MASTLTKDMIRKRLEINTKNSIKEQPFALLFMVALGVALIFMGANATPIGFAIVLYILGACALLLTLLAVLGYLQFRKDVQASKHLCYWLVSAVCTGKKMRSLSGDDASSTDYYYIFLEGYNKILLSPGVCIYDESTGYHLYEQTLYEQTTTGDRFYLVFTEASESAELILPASEWKLSQTEFVERDGMFYPTPDT